METGLDLLRSDRLKERHLLISSHQTGRETHNHASPGSQSRVSKITREQTVMMQVARSFKVKDGQLSSVLASGNPAEERRLATQLKKIEDEKKRRESTLAWNQRNFFIKQVFDQDNELRFVKAYERPSYLDQTRPTVEEDFEETIHLKPKLKSIDFANDLPSSRPAKKFLRRSKTEDALLAHRKEIKSLESQLDNLQIYGNIGVVVKSGQDSDTNPTADLPKLTQVDNAKNGTSVLRNRGEKEKVKFPILKVRALGIFAASFRRNGTELSSKDSNQLPTPSNEVCVTSAENVNEDNSTNSDQSITSIENHKKNLDTSDEGLLTNALTSKGHVPIVDMPIINNDLPSTNIHGPTNGPVDLKTINNKRCLKTKEYKLKDIGMEPTNRKKNEHSERKFSADVKSHDTRKQRENTRDDDNDDDKFQIRQEKVLRKLVSTLPTHLLLKTHKREKEAGGISTDDVRKKMIDKARAGMSRNVLKDPRFKNLEEFLNAGKNATYNPKRTSTEMLENYDDEY